MAQAAASQADRAPCTPRTVAQAAAQAGRTPRTPRTRVTKKAFSQGGKGKGLHSYIRQRGQLSYSIKSQLQEEKEARLNKTPEKEARGNMKLMYVEEKNE